MNYSSIIESFIAVLMQMILIYGLFRQWFRFSVKITLAAAALLEIAELCAEEFATGEYQWLYGIFAVLTIPLLLPMLQSGTRKLALIIFMIYAFIYNAFGTAVMLLLTTVYGALMGKSNQTWFVKETMTQADIVLKWICILISFAAAVWLGHKCVRLLDYLREGETWFFTLAMFLPETFFMFASRTFITNYEDALSGIFVVLYGIFMLFLGVFVTLLLILTFVRLRQENLRLEKKVQEQYQYYQQVLAIQTRLREVRHDLKNRLAAERIMKEEK